MCCPDGVCVAVLDVIPEKSVRSRSASGTRKKSASAKVTVVPVQYVRQPFSSWFPGSACGAVGPVISNTEVRQPKPSLQWCPSPSCGSLTVSGARLLGASAVSLVVPVDMVRAVVYCVLPVNAVREPARACYPGHRCGSRLSGGARHQGALAGWRVVPDEGVR